jgi:hypothetical protein
MRSGLTATLLISILALSAPGAWSQTIAPPPPQFTMLGYIQEATVDSTGAICTTPDPRLRGGTVTINGIKMIVPCNTILQFPASAATWADIFDPTVAAAINPLFPVPVQAAGQSGLALVDNPSAYPATTIGVVGNVLIGPGGEQRYIVGLIAPIEQLGFFAIQGLVNYIDYEFSSFRVGGIKNDPSCVATLRGGGPSCTGSLVQINDPVGRWGTVHTPDARFTTDTGNPTITAGTGYPMCIPRVAPPANDPLCPTGNRPLNGDPRFPTDPFLAIGKPLRNFQMAAAVDGVFPDARQQAPFMVGDQVDVAGNLYQIAPGTDRSAANTYTAAHTVLNNAGIFTYPASSPVYLTIEDFLIGTDGAPVAGLLQEATTRMTVVGFTTDPTVQVDVFALDVNPCTGEETQRLLASIDPAVSPLLGRFVLRVLGGFFMPPTREYRLVSHLGPNPTLVANGLESNQYTFPNFEYIFPENHNLGDPLIPFNFQDLPFLAQGSGPLDGVGGVVGQLDPWPGSPVPPRATCNPSPPPAGTQPIANAGPDITVLRGSIVTLSGSRTLDPNSVGATNSWLQTAGPTVVLTSSTTLNPSFVAPNAATTLTFQLTVTDQFGSGIDTVNVVVTSPVDTLTGLTATWRAASGNGKVGKLTVAVNGSDPTAVLTVEEVSDVTGTTRVLGTMTQTNNPVGSYSFSGTAIDSPRSITVRSNKGGVATTTCGAAVNGRQSCP